MAVYPTDKGSPGTWGAECSAYHAVSTDLATGKIKDGAIQVSSAAPTVDAGVANKKYVDDHVASQVIQAYCEVSSGGSLVGGSKNVTSIGHSSTGIYTINLTSNFASSAYTAVGSLSSANGFIRVASTSAGVITVNTYNTSNVLTDNAFSVMAAGLV